MEAESKYVDDDVSPRALEADLAELYRRNMQAQGEEVEGEDGEIIYTGADGEFQNADSDSSRPRKPSLVPRPKTEASVGYDFDIDNQPELIIEEDTGAIRYIRSSEYFEDEGDSKLQGEDDRDIDDEGNAIVNNSNAGKEGEDKDGNGSGKEGEDEVK